MPCRAIFGTFAGEGNIGGVAVAGKGEVDVADVANGCGARGDDRGGARLAWVAAKDAFEQGGEAVAVEISGVAAEDGAIRPKDCGQRCSRSQMPEEPVHGSDFGTV